AGKVVVVKQISSEIKSPHLWSDSAPDLYRIGTEIMEGKDNILDRLNTFYGIRRISWPIGREGEDNKFYLNGKHVFLNGVCEYEHNMGMSHAFTDEQIVARIMQIKAAGFNAFRDAHQPHSLLYNYHWDRIGMFWWTQFSAQVWFDTPEFRENFKTLLREWVKERRNSPSVIMWGLQNESKLPAEFAQECTDIIREMDPTTSSQRLVSTCNGGTGTDWNVVQNWSGTYGGDPYNYAKDMETQLLNGEYGAWRSLDLHTEGPYVQDAPFSEDRMALLLELKVRLAEEARGKSCGQFQWILNSHENPGRTQNGEGFRELDRVGPVNYKGLFTSWGEPVDAYYMYRSNYASPETEPMVYIVSHTWPDRWTTPGVKDGLIVYSNCDVVELWNDTVYLGYRERQGMGMHMQWDSINVQFNTLRAIGFVNKKYVAEDIIMLNHLPKGSHFNELIINPVNNVGGVAGYNYIYRVNCGGPDYVDSNNKLWHADVHRTDNNMWGSVSWTDEYPGLPAFYASQRRSRDIISGTYDGELFQTFRYGREKLKYQFPVPNGNYRVELYFVEPWYGANAAASCKEWRVFDVAVNGETMIKDLDIWDKARYCYAHKEVLKVKVINGLIDISFPKVRVGQAVISAIAIAAKKGGVTPAPASPGLITNLQSVNQAAVHKRWMDTGDKQYTDDSVCFSYLPPVLHGAEWLQMPKEAFGVDKIASFTLTADADVFVAFDSGVNKLPEWMQEYAFAQMYVENSKGQIFKVYNKRFRKSDEVVLGENAESTLYLVSAVPVTTLESASDLRPINRLEAEDAKPEGENIRRDSIRTNGVVNFAGGGDNSVEFTFTVGVADTYVVRVRYINRKEEAIPVSIKIVDAYDVVMRNDVMILEPTVDDKFKTIKTDTGTQINAGTYRLTISNVFEVEGFILDYVEIQ
ncbi:MAG: DUF4982 domain-containing protein, partial [Prevotellaceae bacterium]|nr:DUF4982 domain-containing protein [Prevotellaceae bacterium]